MPIVTQCTALGCETLTIGPLCIEHEQQTQRVFVRGRPFVRDVLDARRPLTVTSSYVPGVRRASERPVAARSLR